MKRLIILLFIFFHLPDLPGLAQPFTKLFASTDTQPSFKSIAATINRFFDTAKRENRSGYKQWKRWEWFASHHLTSDGKLENYIDKNLTGASDLTMKWGQNQRTEMIESNSGNWTNTGYVGVSNGGNTARLGRINCFAFDPTSGNTVYAGAAGGGIWKSVNAGSNWFAIGDNLPVITISSMVVAPDGTTIYATTGDGFLPTFNPSSPYDHHGIGILKSTDAGNTWFRSGPPIQLGDRLGGSKIQLHPNNSNIVFAALSNGIWRSTDAGNNWVQIALGNINDFEFKPNDANILYYSLMQSSAFRALNLTNFTTTITNLSTARTITRFEIAVSPANNNAVYLLVGPGYTGGGAGTPNGTAMYNGVYYSNDAGVSFTKRNDNLDVFALNADQSWYDNVIYVNPFNADDVLIGGVRTYRSTDGGINFSMMNTTNPLHGDDHALERSPVDGNLWLGDDGGIYKSGDNGQTWTSFSADLIVNEFYRIAGYQGNIDLLLGGTQDNGQFRRNNNTNIFYGSILGLDGMDNIIDFTNSNIMYACNQGGGLWKSSNGGNSFSVVNTPSGGQWVTPIVQLPDAMNPNTIFYGSNTGILRSTDGGTNWTNIGGLNGAGAIAIGKNGSNFNLYASVTGGNTMVMSSNPTAVSPTWTTITSPTTASISAIVVNPVNKDEVWITCSGYTAGDKVFRSFNAGGNWVNFSFSLPNIPVYSIVFGNNAGNPSGVVYIGTELGVFYTEDNIPDWDPFYNGLPMVPVTDLEINYGGGRLYAATFGRGIWQSDLYNGCPGSLILSGNSFGNRFYQASGFIETTQQVTGSTGNNLRLRAGQKITFKPGYRSNYGSYLHAVIGNCGTGVVSKPLKATSSKRD